MKMKWHQISPAEAAEIILPVPDIDGPVNESGEPCPWPWEPPDAPFGQWHCRYCGSMRIAGIPHPDYSFLYTKGAA